MREFYVPNYIIESEKDEQDIADQGKLKSAYSQCQKCKEYVHRDDWTNHRKMYCDPGHERKKSWTTRPTPKRIIGGYVLGVGVNPRPLESWPKQVLRGRCKTCGCELALPNDVCCVVCSGKRGSYQ